MVNLMLLISSIDEGSYSRSLDPDYVPEALLQLFDGLDAPVPTFSEIIDRPDTLACVDACVHFVSPPPGISEQEAKEQAAVGFQRMEEGIQKHCTGPSAPPKLKHFVLPEGEEVSKSSLNTRVRNGKVCQVIPSCVLATTLDNP